MHSIAHFVTLPATVIAHSMCHPSEILLALAAHEVGKTCGYGKLKSVGSSGLQIEQGKHQPLSRDACSMQHTKICFKNLHRRF